MSDWLQKQISSINSLQGKTVKRWLGIEMALREKEDGTPEFHHSTVNYLQMSRLDAELEDEQAARFVTSQDVDLFGLCRCDDLKDVPIQIEADLTRFFSARQISELPTGKIKEVRVTVDSQVISEAHFMIDTNRISMFAGEIYEDSEQQYSVRFLDECVLVQVNGACP